MHEKFCIISDRPAEIHIQTVNGRGRLHRADGPAKSYRDGWSIYAINGVRVPAQVVMAPETLAVEQIQSEQNAEVRRVMISRFGQARYLRESNAVVIDKHESELVGTLWKAERPNDTPLIMLQCLNGSPEPINYQPSEGESGKWVGSRWHKFYWQRVKPDIQSAVEAQKWIHNVPVYDPVIRT
jgi:hypothetical protein